VSSGSAEWADPAGRTTLRVFYKSPAEWASLILAHVSKMAYGGSSGGGLGQLLTVYELHSGAPGAGTAFEGLDADTLLRALRVLEQQGKVDLIPGDVPDETGVRFKV
jgi:hypothetical protein